MKTRKALIILFLTLGLMVSWPEVSEATEMSTAFTYQGHLYDANHAANGLYDFAFKLYDANVGGSKVGTDVNVADVDVIDAYFTVELDFNDANAFNGDARWLEIGIRPGYQNDPCEYTSLSPRQEVTPTPYTLYAKTAGNALTGSGTTNRVAKFMGPNTLGDSALYEHNYYVGVGTTNPRGMFDVDCDGGDIYLDTFSSQIYIGDVDGDGDETLFTVDDSTGKFTFENGKVGIGTVSPVAKLDIDGDGTNIPLDIDAKGLPDWGKGLRITNTGMLDGTNMNINFGKADLPGQTAEIVYYHASDLNDDNLLSLGFWGQKVVNIELSGNVGIGTANPSEKLDVAGNIDVSSNRVKNYKGFPRPDYDSGWVSVAPGTSEALFHYLGGDPDNYVVDFQAKDLGPVGVNIKGFGGYYDSFNGNIERIGFWWDRLTTSAIYIYRNAEDTEADQMRVRIWVYD